MLCPSDSYNMIPYDGTTASVNLGSNWARGNYACNGGLDYIDDGNVGPTSAAWNDKNYRGVMGANNTSQLKQITDGASKTVLLGEIRAGLDSTDARGVWAMAGGCASSLCAHGFLGDDGGPNCPNINADDVFSCNSTVNDFGSQQALNMLGMPCVGNNDSHQQTARSMHNGGVQVSMCDGSVQWIDDSIVVGMYSINTDALGKYLPSFLGPWDLLMLSQDGQVLPKGAF
jgi:prepilin-type processing-associated H-X9-DG protein